MKLSTLICLCTAALILTACTSSDSGGDYQEPAEDSYTTAEESPNAQGKSRSRSSNESR